MTKKLDKRAVKPAAGIFNVADFINSITSESVSSSSESDERSGASSKHLPSKSRSRSLQKSSSKKRKKSAKSSSEEGNSKSSKRRRKSRHRDGKSKKASSNKSNRSKHGQSSLESSNDSEDGSVVRRSSKKKTKKKLLLGNSSISSSSDSSSDEYDARNPKTMIPKKQKENDKWLPVAADASETHEAPSSTPAGKTDRSVASVTKREYKDIMTRIEQAITLSHGEETKSQLAATEAAAAPAPGVSRYSIKLTSGQNNLQQIWVRRLISYFQLQPDPVQLEDGSWLLRSNNSGVVAFLVKRLSSCRLLGARLNGTLYSAHDQPAAAAPDTDSVYAKILEQFVAEYNDNLVTSLVLQVSTESDTSFFGADWQHVYTSGLTNTFLIAADAIRSLGHRLPRPGPPCPRILIVSPDSSTVRCLAMILQPVLTAASTDMLFVKGDGRIDLSREVVLGTVHHLSEAEGQLQLRGLRAMIVDDASFMASSPLHSILIAQLVARLRVSVADYGSINIVAVADRINVQELTKAETLLGCRFIRTDLKQHFTLPSSASSSQRHDPPPLQCLEAPPPQCLEAPPPQRHEAPPPVRYDPSSQTSSYGEAAWPPPHASDAQVQGPPGTAQSLIYSGTTPSSGHPGPTRITCPPGPAPAPGYNAKGQVQQPRIIPPGYPSNIAGDQSALAGYYGQNAPQQHSGSPAYFMNRPPPTVPAPGYTKDIAPQQYSAPPGYGGGPPPQQVKPQQFPQPSFGDSRTAYQQQGGPPGGIYSNDAAHQRPAPTGYYQTAPQRQPQGLSTTEPIDQRQQSVAGQGYCTKTGPPGDLQHQQQHQQQQQQSYSHYYNQ